MLRLAAALVGFLVTFPAFSQQSVSAQPSAAPSPRLVVHARGSAGEPLPLGLTIEGTGDGAVVVVTGLLPGMSLSTGTALGANVWQVPATDIANTWVGPPKDFVGMVDLIAELQLADATVIHRQPIQIEWVATSPAVAAQVPAVTPIPEAVPAPQQEQDDTAMKGSGNPTATIKQHAGRTHQKSIASKVTTPTPSQIPVKAKVTQGVSNEPSPDHMRQSQCDYQGCASAYRSFRASDCTYQPYGGQRRLCENGARQTDVRERASQVSAQTRAQQCNLDLCARFYRSFNPSDCTYQPISGGARRTCDPRWIKGAANAD